MVTVIVFTRHIESCPETSPDYKRCACPKHLRWHYMGKQYRKSAGTNVWAQAMAKAAIVKNKYDHLEFGEPLKTEKVSLQHAVKEFIADKQSQNLSKESIEKHTATFLTNGLISEIKPQDGKCFTLKEMQGYVGGYIEYACGTEDGHAMFVNEEGKLRGLEINVAATMIFHALRGPCDVIVGDAIFLAPGEYD